MSLLLPLALLLATQGAPPNGVYMEAGYDVLFSDRLALLARGRRILGEVGYFTGDYMGSYGFGTYWRFGLGMSWEPIVLSGLRTDPSQAQGSTFAVQFYYPHLTVTRGVDLFDVGLWAKLRLGPVWSVADPDVFYDADAVWGGQLVGEVSGSYNLGTAFKIAPRLGVGVLIDEVRTSYQLTLGIAAYLQLPLKRITVEEPADYWEKDY